MQKPRYVQMKLEIAAPPPPPHGILDSNMATTLVSNTSNIKDL